MSYQDGWAAMNLEMPTRVPRTEYSVGSNWALISAVTGIQVDADSPDELKKKASRLFMGPEYWNMDLIWSTLIAGADLGKYRTSMGHAVYSGGGADFRDDMKALFEDPEDALKFDPLESLPNHEHSVLVKRFENAYHAAAQAYPDAVTMTGVYISCVSGLIELFGWDMLLMAAGVDPEKFGGLTNRYAQWVQQYFNALGDADVPVVMMHDDIVWSEGAFIHPDWYRKYVFPNYKKFLQPVIDSGKKILFTSDANYTEFIDDIAACGVNGFVMEPMTDMRLVAERYGKTHVMVGNADTRILLNGTRQDIRAEVERCMDIGKKCPGFFMAVGNHIPENTPVENAIYYNEVYEELSRR